jgi:hypothetical protein
VHSLADGCTHCGVLHECTPRLHSLGCMQTNGVIYVTGVDPKKGGTRIYEFLAADHQGQVRRRWVHRLNSSSYGTVLAE